MEALQTKKNRFMRLYEKLHLEHPEWDNTGRVTLFRLPAQDIDFLNPTFDQRKFLWVPYARRVLSDYVKRWCGWHRYSAYGYPNNYGVYEWFTRVCWGGQFGHLNKETSPIWELMVDKLQQDGLELSEIGAFMSENWSSDF